MDVSSQPDKKIESLIVHLCRNTVWILRIMRSASLRARNYSVRIYLCSNQRGIKPQALEKTRVSKLLSRIYTYMYLLRIFMTYGYCELPDIVHYVNLLIFGGGRTNSVKSGLVSLHEIGDGKQQLIILLKYRSLAYWYCGARIFFVFFHGDDYCSLFCKASLPCTGPDLISIDQSYCFF